MTVLMNILYGSGLSRLGKQRQNKDLKVLKWCVIHSFFYTKQRISAESPFSVMSNDDIIALEYCVLYKLFTSCCVGKLIKVSTGKKSPSQQRNGACPMIMHNRT